MNTVWPRPARSAARTPWRARLDDVQQAAGPLPRRLLASWRLELDAAQCRVQELHPRLREAGSPCGDGAHALLVLAGARLGHRCDVRQLIDAAAAMELADVAIRWHGAVRDGPPGDPRRHAHNVVHVLGGDLAITRAAGLVAEIGPAAYQVLVRGYGAAQLGRLAPVEPVGPTPLQVAALALGALLGGAALAGGAPGVLLPASSPVRLVWRWAAASGVAGH